MDLDKSSKRWQRLRRAEQVALTLFVGKWTLLGIWVGVPTGLASAGFLWCLDFVTTYRGLQPWLLFLLPICGVAIGALYHWFGKSVAGGNNLLLDRIHDPEREIPFRMAPLITLTTVMTHLFGGSAGREGTAVQMGGTIAEFVVKPFRLGPQDRKILIMTGVAAGFGSVFGTPIAGAVFGLEVLAIGGIKYDALVPCLVSSIVADYVCRIVGIHHHAYDAPKAFLLTPSTFGWTLAASLTFAAASTIFTELTHAIQKIGKDLKGAPFLRPAIGGVLIVGLTLGVGNQTYNGLSLPLIESAFHRGEVPPYAFALKILFTAITLGTGFKGGEVTPLFCIGATLGGAFAALTGQDPALFAALGFVAVFAGAANTPLACAIMGIELFGSELAVPITTACVITYILTGHRGIYLSQRVHHAKGVETFVDGDQILRTYLQKRD